MLLSELGLPPKAYYALKSCGAKTVADLLRLPKNRVQMVQGVGPLTIKKIEFALRRIGLEWTDKVADEPPLTLRDKFAMAALPKVIEIAGEIFAEECASRAYEIADAMMAERKR